MTDHERTALIAAIESARNGKDDRDPWGTWHEMIATVVWQAARKYEPPAVCGTLRNANNVCALTEGHDGDHRAPLHLGGYFGWPREQEPENLCVNCGHPMSYYLHRYNEGLATHAFVSAKEAAKCDYHSTGVREKCE